MTAIKPGYYGNDRVIPTRKLQDAQTVETYSNRDLFLVKQNPESPNFRYGDFQEGCIFAETREDVAASIQFKRIELAELERLGAEPRWIEIANREIARFESLPSALKSK